MNRQIITSALDLDFYKFTMQNFVFQLHKDVPVRYEFKNRSAINLADYIDIVELQEQLDALLNLRFTENNVNFLRKQGFFSEAYLAALLDFRFPRVVVLPATKDFAISFHGTWFEYILLETLVLSIVNELYVEGYIEKHGLDRLWLNRCFIQNTRDKFQVFKNYPWIQFMEFGTRRRASGSLQGSMIEMFAHAIPNQMVGTSNCYWAYEFGLTPKGSLAHEMGMAYSGIYRDELRDSHNRMMRDWRGVYGDNLSISLLDLYGNKFFWDQLTEEQAHQWKGYREDSGDPMVYVAETIAALKSKGVNPLDKISVPSDGLDLPKMIQLGEAFRDQIGMLFGVGTSLSFDFGGTIKPVSIVIKMTEANGYGCVKLSNNIEKAIGKPEDVELFKKTFGYDNTFREECYS